MSRDDIRFHPAVAALYDPIQVYFERFQAPPHRTYLANGLEGTVLEIGVGTGAMVPYYEDTVEDGTRIYGVEPDPGMWRRSQAAIEERDVPMEVICGRGERLPFDDGTFDYVLECGLFCSVPSIDTVLDEIGRVLEPDGEFRFFDHVRSNGLLGYSQDALTPLWRRIGGNCHLDRRILPTLEENDSVRIETVERRRVGHWPIRTFVRGTATPVKR
ncbi:class I SAM-dependent methyltransferase [Natrarchaeobius chitinivorans]|uniref:Class I SAM-dependent methyltransferase n=1 Tax=Natrarchaeobius chitinivorans TaxID=1679083 RepID=A0A3N6LZQ9_NATCH|nr:class I SAM-dependent methyltransferase [Natrarchaeobius chitinivorans]RQG96418.1 class I SAM-dependent methyltransferase [Natrarchaeobius chitinivorans]